MNLLDLISVNRDAIATNRGFYYQYLSVIIRWLNNYINSEDADIYTEVEDDIKEVGDKLIFTQVKCYSNSFSLKSIEIKKALVNFFALYLEYKDQHDHLILKFITNSSLGKNQNILRKWINNQPPTDEEVVKLCRIAVTEILNGEVEKKKNSILKKRKLTAESEKKLEDAFIDFQKLITNNDLIDSFTSKIKWEFKDLPPIEATELLLAEINNLLEHSLFIKHPKKIILDAMLSDIYKKSQLPAIIDRKVNNSSLKILLDKTEEELSNFCDQRFVKLFDLRFDILENKINKIENVLNTTIKIQEKHGAVLKQIEENNFSKQIIIPPSITKIPYIDQSTIIGRDKKVDTLHGLLLAHKNICVNGDGGMGKSSLLKIYVNKFKDEYDHII